jgi:hypothetical protein
MGCRSGFLVIVFNVQRKCRKQENERRQADKQQGTAERTPRGYRAGVEVGSTSCQADRVSQQPESRTVHGMHKLRQLHALSSFLPAQD